jgi:hypothetical protein
LFLKNFKPGRGMSIFVIVFFPLLMSLGAWQVVRGFDKQDVLDQYDVNKSLAPIESSELSIEDIESNYYRTVSLEGQFMCWTIEYIDKNLAMRFFHYSKQIQIIIFLLTGVGPIRKKQQK